MTIPVTHIYDLAHDLLDAIVAGYAAASVDLPARTVVTEGEPAWDCEQLTVTLVSTVRGLPDGPTVSTSPCAGPRTANIHASIVRCASSPNDDGSPPSTTIIEGYSQAIWTDAWLLPKVIIEAVLADTLGVSCDDIRVGDLEIRGPEGGFGGVDLSMQWLLGVG